MITVQKTRQLYESYVGPNHSQQGGRNAFINRLRHGLGLSDEKGNDYKDRCGNRVLRESKLDPTEFATNELALAIMGEQTRGWFADRGNHAKWLAHHSLVESQHAGDGRALLEAVGMGVDVSTFADINAWTAATGGLLERKILEGFESPDFIGQEIMPDENTKIAEGQKVIGISRIGDKSIERQPGQPHARAGVTEKFVTLGKTRENALAVDVLKEAAFFDLTGQLLQEAGDVGYWVRWRKEMDILDAFLGVSTSTGLTTGKWKFVYDNTAYPLYSTGQTVGTQSVTLQNKLTGNEMLDWTNFQTAWLLSTRMKDPETGTRIQQKFDSVLVMPAKYITAGLILGAKETEVRTAGTSTQATAATLQVRRTPGAPFGAGDYKVTYSTLAEQRALDADGLALSQSDTDKLWYLYQKGRVGKYMVNWPMTIMQAPPNNYEMIDRGIVASFFAHERGCPSIWSIWSTIQCTG